jgi:hypothetical protein
MLVARSDRRKPEQADPAVVRVLRDVSAQKLCQYVEMLAFPRHYLVESSANRRARDLLLGLLRDFGCAPVLQGRFDNIVVHSGAVAEGPCLLLGAHYDTVPGSPGADDNASAVAVCLECARILRQHDVGSTMIVFFNREEDGLLGSREFVAHLAAGAAHMVAEAHIFEMVGFTCHVPGSQKMPGGLPILTVRDVGDFLALLANRNSNAIAETLISLSATYLAPFPVAALKIYLGIEKHFAHLLRSDHAPFWEARLPAIMWTDTSEFRNSHYHMTSDTPETLDYEFLAQVTRLALARALTRSGS